MRKIKPNKKIIKKKQKRPKKRGKTQKEFSWKRFIFKALCVLFFVIVVYVLLYSEFVKIKKIEVDGNNIVDSNLIIEEIKSQTQENNLLQISKQNFFITFEKELQKNILESFPKIKNVEIEKVFPDQINIFVEEYDLIPIICMESQEGQCFILENDGKIVAEADFNSLKLEKNKTIIIIDENKNDIAKIGEEFISEKKLANIIFLGRELTYALDTKIEQPFVIPARGASEVKFTTDEGWYLQVDTVDSPEITLKVLDLFFRKGFGSRTDVRRSDLEYVDVRTNEKIYYKVEKSEELDAEVEDDEENNN
ncbi:MAG: FtsQ-type POTRA domain-containing protein [Candidatus Moranbacteria bacterium]|nr:FtsQ-type POTRA domain-containing protein [Candidatus Moranbacteria bacterium]